MAGTHHNTGQFIIQNPSCLLLILSASSDDISDIGASISSGRRPIGAELERMVTIEGLLMEVVSIVIQHPLNPLYPVVKDKFLFRPLNSTQEFLDASEKILWSGELLSCQCPLHVLEKPEVRRCAVRTVRRMQYLNNRIVSEKF
jgi:hypothetical protein